MSLTRKMLKAMGIEDEKIEQIIDAHTETVEALKEQRDTFKANAEKLTDVQAELDKANEQIKNAGNDEYKEKYEKLSEEYKQYKSEQELKAVRAEKTQAYKDLLKKVGVSENRIESILKVTDIDNVDYADGKIKDADKLEESLKTEWADFIVKSEAAGINTPTPPAVPMKKFTKEDIKKMTPQEINQNFDAIKASLKGENN